MFRTSELPMRSWMVAALFLGILAYLPALVTAQDTSITYTAFKDSYANKQAEFLVCIDKGGSLASDNNEATHNALTTAVRKVYSRSPYFAYLGGTTMGSVNCPAPEAKTPSIDCVWSWASGNFASTAPFDFYQGNLYPMKGEGDGLYGSRSLNGQINYWGLVSYTQVFPGDQFQPYMVLMSYDKITDSWGDNGEVNGMVYYTSDRNRGKNRFLSLCRFGPAPTTTTTTSRPEDTSSPGTTSRPEDTSSPGTTSRPEDTSGPISSIPPDWTFPPDFPTDEPDGSSSMWFPSTRKPNDADYEEDSFVDPDKPPSNARTIGAIVGIVIAAVAVIAFCVACCCFRDQIANRFCPEKNLINESDVDMSEGEFLANSTRSIGPVKNNSMTLSNPLGPPPRRSILENGMLNDTVTVASVRTAAMPSFAGSLNNDSADRSQQNLSFDDNSSEQYQQLSRSARKVSFVQSEES